MSLAAIPAFFSAAITFAAASELSARAAAAVFASVVTPNDSVAVSGVTSTVPVPFTCTVPGWAAPPSACASSGAPTPANSEASRSPPASQITWRDFIYSLYACTAGTVTGSRDDAQVTRHPVQDVVVDRTEVVVPPRLLEHDAERGALPRLQERCDLVQTLDL